MDYKATDIKKVYNLDKWNYLQYLKIAAAARGVGYSFLDWYEIGKDFNLSGNDTEIITDILINDAIGANNDIDLYIETYINTSEQITERKEEK